MQNDTPSAHKHRWFPIVGAVICIGLMITGGYILLLALSPMIFFTPLSPERVAEVTNVMNSQPIKTDINRLQIPRLNLDLPIVEGSDAKALDLGAWHRWPERGDPLKGGNFILSGHRFLMGWTPYQTGVKSPFYHIDQLQLGDSMLVDWQGQRYTYTIEEKYEVRPDGYQIESPTKDARMTLYSCTFGGSADGRDVIIARLHQ